MSWWKKEPKPDERQIIENYERQRAEAFALLNKMMMKAMEEIHAQVCTDPNCTLNEKINNQKENASNGN
jgi:hypothetical protein